MRKKIFLALSLVWMIVIFLFSAREAQLSSQDSASVGELIGKIFVPGFAAWEPQKQLEFAKKIDHPVRKTAHATEYAVLGFFLAGSYSDRRKKWRFSIGVPWMIGTAYAVSDEFHQWFVPGRSCQVSDMLLDSCGVFAGVFVGQVLWRCLVGRLRRG